MNFFNKIKESLIKTKNFINQKLNDLFKRFKKIDEEFLEMLEEILIEADIGVVTSEKIIDDLRRICKEKNIKETTEIKNILKDIILEIMMNVLVPETEEKFPKILLIIGINGVGKTTSVAKIANLYKKNKKKVLLAAADTFRAAAVEQLKMWAEKSKIQTVSRSEGSDPTSVVYEAIELAKKENFDVVICDTAGRLHNNKNLMEELKKMKKIMDRQEGFSKEVMLIIDATTGQNAAMQVKCFREVLINIDSIILTKLDSTSKGGILISIKNEYGISPKYITIGENIDDIIVFDAKNFIENIFD